MFRTSQVLTSAFKCHLQKSWAWKSTAVVDEISWAKEGFVDDDVWTKDTKETEEAEAIRANFLGNQENLSPNLISSPQGDLDDWVEISMVPDSTVNWVNQPTDLSTLIQDDYRPSPLLPQCRPFPHPLTPKN